MADGVSLPDGEVSEITIDNIKTKEDLVKAISAGVNVPFDVTLKVLGRSFCSGSEEEAG